MADGTAFYKAGSVIGSVVTVGALVLSKTPGTPATGLFKLVGGLAGVAGAMIFGYAVTPDNDHAEIMNALKELHNKLDVIDNDIKNLEDTIVWEATKLQYADVVSRIKEGVFFLAKAASLDRADSEGFKTAQDQAYALCNDGAMGHAVTALIDGLTGQGEFRNNILDAVYKHTEGDRPKMVALTGRLYQLLLSGVLLVVAYQASTHGKRGGEVAGEEYAESMNTVEEKVEEQLKRCVDNFEANLKNDLKLQLDQATGNADGAVALLNKISSKYDFKDMVVLIYNDPFKGDEKHYFSNIMEVMHENKKCGVVYHRAKDYKSSADASQREAVVSLIHSIETSSAKTAYDTLQAGLTDKGIAHNGIAVIQTYRSELSKAATEVIANDVIWVRDYIIREEYSPEDFVTVPIISQFTFFVLLN